MTNLHSFEAASLEGEPVDLGAYAGKVVLVVNVASACGLTPHYEGLEALHREHAARGFSVLGFPCNQFGAQEPGTAAEIRDFCSSRYQVTFPMFAKIDVNGDDAHPLYRWLTAQATEPEGAGPVQWNFGKFVVGKDGAVAARFAPMTKPDDPALLAAIERALSG